MLAGKSRNSHNEHQLQFYMLDLLGQLPHLLISTAEYRIEKRNATTTSLRMEAKIGYSAEGRFSSTSRCTFSNPAGRTLRRWTVNYHSNSSGAPGPRCRITWIGERHLECLTTNVSRTDIAACRDWSIHHDREHSNRILDITRSIYRYQLKNLPTSLRLMHFSVADRSILQIVLARFNYKSSIESDLALE